MLSIRCSKIKSEKELKFIEGYSWNTSKLAREEFERLRPTDTGFKIGNVCLDLIDDNGDIKDTITITTELFEMKRANSPIPEQTKEDD